MLAKRSIGKPLQPPSYSIKNVPRCSTSNDGRLLVGSTVQEVTKREDLVDCMAEMVLLCNEVMRRQDQPSTRKKTSKPLSLEYIADRMDIDDPIFGYYVRTSPAQDVMGGMLQGFITVTTFTNWQRSFQWDSMHDSAFAFDDQELGRQMISGERRYDADGSLAEALQATVHYGDIWDEGIVWPRIAEISLLGGLGCGKALLSLMIEKLECMPPSRAHNYDYVALQATHNSVSFYERMGFVRVGAITNDEQYLQKQNASAQNDTENEPTRTDSANDVYSTRIVSGPTQTYVTEKGGETPITIAKKFNVDVWDIVFLNHGLYNDIAPRSWLYQGTEILIPSTNKAKQDAITNARRVSSISQSVMETGGIKWYVAKENETPKSISKRFKIPCKDLIAANHRIPGLVSNARLKAGTKLKVSHLHIHDDFHIPYCHWTFPDDKFENTEPSYMMVRKLNRRSGAAAKHKPFQGLLASPIVKYSPQELQPIHSTNAHDTPNTKIRSKKSRLRLPAPPKKPVSAFTYFCRVTRKQLKNELEGEDSDGIDLILSSKWRNLPVSEKEKYKKIALKAKDDYEDAMVEYDSTLTELKNSQPSQMSNVNTMSNTSLPRKPKFPTQPLFNEVVKLNSEGMREHGTDHRYYYVLTYIPDLQWCHLCPMIQNETFENGRPRWILVDESLGKEIDTSTMFVEYVRSNGVKGVPDADDEEWEIFEGDKIEKPPPKLAPIFLSVVKQKEPKFDIDRSTKRRKMEENVDEDMIQKRQKVWQNIRVVL